MNCQKKQFLIIILACFTVFTMAAAEAQVAPSRNMVVASTNPLSPSTSPLTVLGADLSAVVPTMPASKLDSWESRIPYLTAVLPDGTDYTNDWNIRLNKLIDEPRQDVFVDFEATGYDQILIVPFLLDGQLFVRRSDFFQEPKIIRKYANYTAVLFTLIPELTCQIELIQKKDHILVRLSTENFTRKAHSLAVFPALAGFSDDDDLEADASTYQYTAGRWTSALYDQKNNMLLLRKKEEDNAVRQQRLHGLGACFACFKNRYSNSCGLYNDLNGFLADCRQNVLNGKKAAENFLCAAWKIDFDQLLVQTKRSFDLVWLIAKTAEEAEKLILNSAEENFENELLQIKKRYARIDALAKSHIHDQKQMTVLYDCLNAAISSVESPAFNFKEENKLFYTYLPYPFVWQEKHYRGKNGMHAQENVGLMINAYYDRGQLAQEPIAAFLDAQRKDGAIPYKVGPHGNWQSWWGSGKDMSMPVLSMVILEIYKVTGDHVWLTDCYQHLDRFYDFCMQYTDRDHDGLNEADGCVYRDAEDVLWHYEKIPLAKCETVDANSFMARWERDMRDMALELGLGKAVEWDKRFKRRGELMNKYMWDKKTHAYYAIDAGTKCIIPKTRHLLESTFYPLFAGIASKEQADYLVKEHLTNPKEFWPPYPVPCVAINDPYYIQGGSFRGGVYAFSEYCIVSGLLDYGYECEAKYIMESFIKKIFDSGKLYEWSDPVTGGPGCFFPKPDYRVERYYIWNSIGGIFVLWLNNLQPELQGEIKRKFCSDH